MASVKAGECSTTRTEAIMTGSGAMTKCRVRERFITNQTTKPMKGSGGLTNFMAMELYTMMSRQF